MKRAKSWVWFMSIGLLLGLWACQKTDLVTPDEDSYTEEEISMDKEFGGFNTRDEMPGFGDQSIQSEFAADESAADPISADVESSIMDSGLPAYFVRITWGHLEGDSTATEQVDWSGYAEVNKGTLGVLKLIRFERSTDRLVLPRESKKRVDFTSVTTTHFDGLLFVIIDNDTAASNVDGQFTFTAGAYSQTFSFAELDSMERIDAVDDQGNEVSIISRGKTVQPFAGGFFSGRWIRMSDRHGRFFGRWIDSMGNNAGFLKGIWGERGHGNNGMGMPGRAKRVMFGKYIHMDGRFGGLLAGEWGYADDADNHGWLKGRWFGRHRQLKGRFKGVWKSGKPGDGRGFFHGRWIEKQQQDGE
ncbi:MAG: hypothetical protein Q9P14_18825 [candidate division KSB1 bacterium]|nr:hypothetical protein [candidate division KSB1 bacterium]